MVVTKIFMGINFVENFMPIIFGNLKFFSKVHILRENWEKVISGSRFEPSTEGDRDEDTVSFLVILGVMLENSQQ